MPGYLNDLRHAVRALLRARAFTAVCVASLGLGMGVVFAMFTFLRMVVGTPAGVNDDRLVELVVRPTGQLRARADHAILDAWSWPDYLDVRATKGMDVTGWARGEALLQPADRGPATRVPTMYVASNYFATVGVGIPLGPGFTRADDATRAAPEAVLSHRAWQLRFGSDPGVIGRAITVDRHEYVVVGVAPEGFRGHVAGLNEPHHQLWLPLSHHPRLTAPGDARWQRDAGWVRTIARLRPGTTVAQADDAVQAAMAALARQYPSTNQDKVGGVEPYFPPGSRLRTQIRRAQALMYGLAGVVLLVVGLNVSGMMVVRSAIRERDLAVRSALGATRWRLIRHHLAEALVLALLSGGCASLVLFGGPVVVAGAFGTWGPWLDLFEPDVTLAAQVLAVCLVTSLVLGLLPAVRFSRASVVHALKNDSAGSGRRVGRLQRLTAAAQAGIAVPFLVICGIQFDQARVAVLTDVGFQPRGLYAARVDLATVTSDAEERRLFLRAVQADLAGAPGVAAASVGDGLPLGSAYRNVRVTREGREKFVTAHTTRVSGGYLDAIGTRLLAGRAIDASDREGAERVALLSEPLARQLFPSGGAIGQRIGIAAADDELQPHTVVGITGDLVSTEMGSPRLQLFLSLEQHPASSVVLIARGAPADPSIRRALDDALASGLRLLPGQQPESPPQESPLRELITGEDLIENSRRDLLTGSGVAGAAAAVALVLTALGVYGVIAFMVATRTREIGVRVALGASAARVMRDVVGDALQLVVPGVAVGLLLAAAWVRLADPTWYPLGGVEPLVYTMAAATALLVAVLAGIPSARRAAAVQPIVAIRAE